MDSRQSNCSGISNQDPNIEETMILSILFSISLINPVFGEQ